MNLHEYQAKALFHRYGIPVPSGKTAASPAEARAVAEELGGERWVIKAQVHSGGRGKAGGVVFANSLSQVEQEAARLLGSRLITRQSGPEGLPVHCLLIESPLAVERELYLGVLIDRAQRRIAFMASQTGGMEIEAVAAEDPAQILMTHVHPAVGLQPWQSRRLGFGLGLAAPQRKQLDHLMRDLYRLFLDCDARLIEVNPLVLCKDGDLMALDAKISLDPNALWRHPELAALRDRTQEDPREVAAAEQDLNYIHLPGTIGCLVNGAGLAMATMDLVKLHGGEPANFLDVGGTATAARVAEAFKLILSEKRVKAVLVNIFGGIVRCDLIAEGIVQAVREVHVSVPLVVRLEGTKAEQGLAILAESQLPILTASSLDEAAAQAVAAAR